MSMKKKLIKTYYVVGRNLMALKRYLGFFNINYAIDYMLETIFLGCYLLYILYWYLYKIDENKVLNTLNINSQNNNKPVIKNYTNIQSAENCKGFSETTRQLSNISIFKSNNNNIKNINTSLKNISCNLEEDNQFWKWFAGILDGDGNFDIRNINGILKLKTIRIKLHNRDVRILTRIQNYLHLGRIRINKNKPYSIYEISKKEDMKFIINKINGLIRIKVDSYKKACEYLDIEYIEANYNIEKYDPYFSGLIDTDGTIVYNYSGNRIECNLEFKYNEYTKKLNLDKVIPNYKPSILLREKKIIGNTKIFKSICFKYQTVNGMVYLYDYFLKNRLYSDYKFYRITKIKSFLEIRDYKNYSKNSVEFKIYSYFILDWIQYKNPLWYKIPFVDKIR